MSKIETLGENLINLSHKSGRVGFCPMWMCNLFLEDCDSHGILFILLFDTAA